MIFLGRKIYFDKLTGAIIYTRGELSGAVRETTTEEDFETFTALAERSPETVGCLKLEYGQLNRDFEAADDWWVEPDTLELKFLYRDPNEPEAPSVFQKPLSVEVEELKAADFDNKEAIALLFELQLMGVGM
ncbi:hypothetical protein [Paenibacillus sp. HGF5]|uniref:hypothetical protein n=1 Tax=Paenibacillus sp. HGF5 TaxID=908341 RepID=UPI000207294C|nr:hypothetical protein [Paenibacillus sp. HGF5]EGG33326.1 hypothetical protein HMPREF9412_2255 [Paenibacillus sp. HGF5]